MRSQLYLWEKLRQKYIEDLTFIKEMFIERIQPIFANAEEEAISYRNNLWKEIEKSVSPEEGYSDLSDYDDFAQEEA